MPEEKTIRAFLAIDPPPEVLAAVERLQDKLKRQISGSVSWTRPRGNHLTLKFFGNIDRTVAKDISYIVKSCISNVPRMLLRIENIGAFPDLRKPRILWIGTSGDITPLTWLQNKLDKSFVQLGFPQESRPFQAHLTLGRIKDARAASGISEAIKKYGNCRAGEFHVAELILFQSNLTPQGAIYTRLAEFPFGNS